MTTSDTLGENICGAAAQLRCEIAAKQIDVVRKDVSLYQERERFCYNVSLAESVASGP